MYTCFFPRQLACCPVIDAGLYGFIDICLMRLSTEEKWGINAGEFDMDSPMYCYEKKKLLNALVC